MSHHAARRSTLAGGAASGAASAPAAKACSGAQSFSVLRDGTRFQMRWDSGRADDVRLVTILRLAMIFLPADVRNTIIGDLAVKSVKRAFAPLRTPMGTGLAHPEVEPHDQSHTHRRIWVSTAS